MGAQWACIGAEECSFLFLSEIRRSFALISEGVFLDLNPLLVSQEDFSGFLEALVIQSIDALIELFPDLFKRFCVLSAGQGTIIKIKGIRWVQE